MPFVTMAVAIAIGIGLWRDTSGRTAVASDITRTSLRISAFVLELAIR
jgi:hypothetical protein